MLSHSLAEDPSTGRRVAAPSGTRPRRTGLWDALATTSRPDGPAYVPVCESNQDTSPHDQDTFARSVLALLRLRPAFATLDDTAYCLPDAVPVAPIVELQTYGDAHD